MMKKNTIVTRRIKTEPGGWVGRVVANWVAGFVPEHVMVMWGEDIVSSDYTRAKITAVDDLQVYMWDDPTTNRMLTRKGISRPSLVTESTTIPSAAELKIVTSVTEGDVLVNLGLVNAEPRTDDSIVTIEIAEPYWSTFTGRRSEVYVTHTYHVTEEVWVELGDTDAWTDPACGCTRSPDVPTGTPCPDHGVIAQIRALVGYEGQPDTYKYLSDILPSMRRGAGYMAIEIRKILDGIS